MEGNFIVFTNVHGVTFVEQIEDKKAVCYKVTSVKSSIVSDAPRIEIDIEPKGMPYEEARYYKPVNR
jgi:hypothetical protein